MISPQLSIHESGQILYNNFEWSLVHRNDETTIILFANIITDASISVPGSTQQRIFQAILTADQHAKPDSHEQGNREQGVFHPGL